MSAIHSAVRAIFVPIVIFFHVFCFFVITTFLWLARNVPVFAPPGHPWLTGTNIPFSERGEGKGKPLSSPNPERLGDIHGLDHPIYDLRAINPSLVAMKYSGDRNSIIAGLMRSNLVGDLVFRPDQPTKVEHTNPTIKLAV